MWALGFRGLVFLSSSRKRGFAHERDLVKKLWNHGFAVVRAPASGSKARHVVYPDVIALYKGKVIVAEVKTASKPRPIYIEEEKVNRLVEFAERAGGEAYVAVKVIGTGDWVFIPVSKLTKSGGKYRVSREAIAEGVKLEALVSLVKGVKKLTEFTASSGRREPT